MNLKLAKKIRKYVRDTYPFMAQTAIYETDLRTGARKLASVCQRGFIQNIKRNIKRKKNGQDLKQN